MHVNKENYQKLTHHEITDFVIRNFEDVKNSRNINELIKFHSINKFLLMSHDPLYTRQLGFLVANQKKSSLPFLLENYGEAPKLILGKEPTTRRHTNVIQKIFGYFKKDLTSAEKSSILKMISDYGLGQASLESVLSYLEEMTRRFQKTYLIRQTYFLLYSKVTLDPSDLTKSS